MRASETSSEAVALVATEPERVVSTTRMTHALVVRGRFVVAGPPPVRNEVTPPGATSRADTA